MTYYLSLSFHQDYITTHINELGPKIGLIAWDFEGKAQCPFDFRVVSCRYFYFQRIWLFIRRMKANDSHLRFCTKCCTVCETLMGRFLIQKQNRLEFDCAA